MHPVETPARNADGTGGNGPAIEVEELRKVYPGGKTAVDGLSFSVGTGEIFGLLGPNGSGKTTTVRILVTLLRKTSGVSKVGGFDTSRDAARIRPLIGYAAQSTGIDDDLTVHENLAVKGVLYGLTPKEVARRAEEVTAAFSLTDVANQRAGRFSGGMRRRVDLAIALLNNPPVLFLDEPTTGLDPQSRNAVWELLRRLRYENGMTILLTTQYLEEADLAADRVAIIDRGKLITTGTPAELKEQVGQGRIMLTIPDAADRYTAAQLLAGLPQVARVEEGQPLTVHVHEVASSIVPVIQALDGAGIEVTAVDQAKATLDDVFLQHTGHRPRVEARVEGAVSSIFSAVHGRRAR
jgi:ABC-type multidrug transport system ATPase subunit